MPKTSKADASDTVNKGISKPLLTFMHLIASVQFCFAIYYDYNYVVFPRTDENVQSTFGGKFKFLTFLNAIIQAYYYVLCLVNDFIGSSEVTTKKLPAIRKLKDYIFSCFAFPIALNVGVSFWTLYAIDRELVFPRVLDAVFPWWLNHIMHTNIVVFIVYEMFTSFSAYPKKKVGIASLSAFMLCYLVWIHIVKHYSGVWVYPVLEVLQLPQRILFFIAVLAFTVFLYLFGEWLNKKVWASQLKLAQRPKNKKN